MDSFTLDHSSQPGRLIHTFHVTELRPLQLVYCPEETLHHQCIEHSPNLLELPCDAPLPHGVAANCWHTSTKHIAATANKQHCDATRTLAMTSLLSKQQLQTAPGRNNTACLPHKAHDDSQGLDEVACPVHTPITLHQTCRSGHTE